MASANDRSKASPAAMTASIDTDLARLVIDRRLATHEEIDRCRQLLQNDSNSTLAQVMVAQSVVTPGQIQRIKREVQESRDRQIPGYRLLAKLGTGGMGTVYKGVQESLDRVVAIKVLLERLSSNPEYVKMFYKEGRAAAKLNHPNIVQAIDVGEANGRHYFVMEYVEGPTLYDMLSGGKAFSEQEALKVIVQIAKALKHAHDQGFIHRDVKPKNIMMAPDGTAKLADMGLARAATDVEAAHAEAGKAFGTPYYISPEQIRGEVDIDFRADIYSLGATLYHVLTGRVPFEAPTPVAVMHKHLKEALIPPDHINTNLSAGIGEVVEVMMAKERKRRYASTGDLLLDLEAIAAGRAPRQARKRINADVLSGLAEGESEQPEPAKPIPQNLMLYLIILGAALAVSVLVNIIQILLR